MAASPKAISPKVSAIVPAYNIRSYIVQALASLECQSFHDFEAIVVDDGSSDGTALEVEPFVKRDSRFKLLRKQNGGLSSARNYGIRNASGEYIALLDGDDIYHPDKLANHVDRLNSNPDIGVVYSASRAIRDDGSPTFMYLSGKPVSNDPLLALLCKNFIGHGSNAVFRRCIYDEVGEFDEGLRSCEDLDFWLRVAGTRRWRFYREPSVLCYYRIRPSGLSFNVTQMQQTCEQVLQGAYHRNPELVESVLPTAYAYMYRYLSRLCLQASNIEQARDFMKQALKADSSIFVNDPRSLLTLIAVHLAPLTRFMMGRVLGKATSAS
ncbi:glycosyltransferase [Scytonema sp. UIC 10036]|uniref:glycosyltransferase family 2 protein n=1 Tax=Scytonema sp. UIC 10036 TaxID=2304196 RepID=UPI0012DAD2D9|nr:glycosyltransferase [Scytonema sp. UIC 10036]MUH00166.1 glycosyltransferase [Scytonema sp. UIC 10036]